MIHACGDGPKANQWCNLYNKTVRFSKRRAIKIHYRPGPKPPANPPCEGRLKNYRIISFADAGLASLEGDRGVESNLLVPGQTLFRDSVIRCHGYLIDPKCAKIQRVRCSSLAVKSHAAVTAGDYALRYQVLPIGMFTHSYEIRRLRHPTDCPTMNPFSDSPSGSQLKADKLFWAEFGEKWNPGVRLEREDVLWNCAKFESRQVGFPFRTMGGNELAELVRAKNDFILPKPLLLTDCCSLHSIILRMQPMQMNDVLESFWLPCATCRNCWR